MFKVVESVVNYAQVSFINLSVLLKFSNTLMMN